MNPANVSNLKQVGRSLMLLGKFRSSMEVLEEAKRLDPRDWEVWHDEGICNAKARSYEKAVEVREKERDRQRSCCGRGADLDDDVLRTNEQTRMNGRKCLERANEIQPHDTTYLALGGVHKAMSKHKRAVQAYSQGLKQSPGNPELLTACGLAYLRIDENYKAFELLLKAISVDPKNPNTILATCR